MQVKKPIDGILIDLFGVTVPLAPQPVGDVRRFRHSPFGLDGRRVVRHEWIQHGQGVRDGIPNEY